MNPIKKNFIQLALDCNVLQWGKFTLKSGRISPYFFNAGLFYDNHALYEVGTYYADLILQHHLPCDHLFGPAYKGISLATATAMALHLKGIKTLLTFDRKEAKDHGEGGTLIGAPLSPGHTVLIDDVITAGTAFRNAQRLIEQHQGQLSNVIIALDRCEKGLKQQSALEDIRSQNIGVYSIITLFDLIEYLEDDGQRKQSLAMKAYQAQYST